MESKPIPAYGREMERIEAIVTGRVQGVLYRDFASRRARALGLTGVARNCQDGSVFVAAEGESSGLAAFVEQLKEGSLLSRVEGVSVQKMPATGAHARFEIDY